MQEIKDLAKNSKIAIYGAGEAGRIIKKYLSENRSDVSIVCFFDERISGKVDDINIYPIASIKDYENTFDIIIPASFSNIGIMLNILEYFGINKTYVTENIRQIEHSPIIVDDKRLEIVKNIFTSKESKKLFEIVVKAYLNSNNCQSLFEYLKNFQYPQYLAFLSPEKIKNVISGGACDGATSLYFANEFKNLEKLYAFEPMYQAFKKEAVDKLINETNKIEIVEKGLYENSGELNLIKNNASSRINTYLESEITEKIKVTSIDDFIKEKNIEKVDFIKMDIEGSELPALKGGEKTLISHRPQLAICIYHSYNDLFEIPIYLDKVLKDYKFEIMHHSLSSCLETVFYAIPNELS